METFSSETLASYGRRQYFSIIYYAIRDRYSSSSSDRQSLMRAALPLSNASPMLKVGRSNVKQLLSKLNSMV
jgi:hypothetical protein